MVYCVCVCVKFILCRVSDDIFLVFVDIVVAKNVMRAIQIWCVLLLMDPVICVLQSPLITLICAEHQASS